MIYNRLGKSNIRVSLLGYGGWALGQKGWQGINEYQSRATLIKAYEEGINFFDTAPIYGMGKSESIIGQELSSVRKKIYIATKFGLVWEKGKVLHNVSRESILKEVEASLKRLKTDYIDLYQLHWKDKNTLFEETFNTLNKLKKEGIIKQIGLCNVNIEDIKQISRYSDIISVQNRYNYLQREVEDELLQYCKQKQIGFIAYSALAQGLLSGKISKTYKMSKHDIRRFNTLFNDNDLFEKAIEKIKSIDNPLKTSLDYLKNKEEVSTLLISMTKPKHLIENIKYINL